MNGRGRCCFRRVRVQGHPPSVCPTALVSSLSWGVTRIVYGVNHQLFEVSPDGGTPRALAESRLRIETPFLLPGDRAVLYTEHGKVWTSGDERVMIRPLTTADPPRVLLQDAADARYLATGHIAFLRQGTIFVAPFDVETLQLRGAEVAVLSGVAQATASWFGPDLTLAGQFAVSPQGTLAYGVEPNARHSDVGSRQPRPAG